MYFKILEYLYKTVLTIIQFEEAANEMCFGNFKQNPSKIPVIKLILCKVAGFQPAILLILNSFTTLFKGFSQTIRTPLFQSSYLSFIVARVLVTHPMLCKTPYIPYPNFFKFCPTPVTNRFQASSPLLFLRPCFFGWMGDCATFDVLFYPNDIMGLYMRSVGTLILEGRCYVFYEKQVY